MLIAEAAPAAIPPLGALLVLLVALGLILIGKLLVAALFGVAKGVVNQTIGRIPWIGGKIAGAATAPIEHIEKRLVGYLQHAVTGVEAGVAISWHVLAWELAATGHAIASAAQAVYNLDRRITAKLTGTASHGDVARIQRQVKAQAGQSAHDRLKVTHVVKVLDHPATSTIGQTARAATKPLRGEIARLREQTDARLGALEYAAGVAIPGELGGIQADTDVLRRGLDWVRRKVGDNSRRFAAGAMAAAVAFALGKLGAGWVRCGNWRKLGNTVCRTNPSLIEGLLALVATEEVIRDLPTLVREMQAITRETTEAIKLIAQV